MKIGFLACSKNKQFFCLEMLNSSHKAEKNFKKIVTALLYTKLLLFFSVF